ncbi:molybdopterin-binding protein [Natroniella sulfidigena]|uniref:molybdopterin-binding protein n=1 Tax=Natroniella sulfidigena TaxID=723921 RepID=UPI00200A7E66|nr:molybdopterin-binding protein [Natroniella sulfidigena]MCK8817581.1 molybdopterin-binding protein [Natroniella sulfidigena]
MKKVAVEEAVGMILGHDLTQIIPGEFKGAKFKKGHVIKAEDIPVLKKMGKNHIYSLELEADQCHENEAAERIAKGVQGENIKISGPSEGKMNLVAEQKGLLKIDLDLLKEINGLDDIVLATLHTNTVVEEGQVVAGTRINPLVIEEEKIEEIEIVCQKEEDILKVATFFSFQIGVLITGDEVYYGEIEDRFAAVFEEKVAEFESEILEVKYVPDDVEEIKKGILDLVEAGAEVIITAGGMSVDPDDVTPTGIRATGAEVESYGAPVLPGSMFMLAYLGQVPILGVPACGMYHQATVFDLVFPSILAKEKVTRDDIIALAHGGLCLQCDVCRYPVCPFGKR